ncbi:MAG: hypothetical protein OXF79_30070 [Chloroflexi bacterium]|nr:hypothetical protein [Chloroflexota bacterium]
MDQHIAAWTLKRLRAVKSVETIELLPFQENGRTVYQSPPHLRRPLERAMKRRRKSQAETVGKIGQARDRQGEVLAELLRLAETTKRRG